MLAAIVVWLGMGLAGDLAQDYGGPSNGSDGGVVPPPSQRYAPFPGGASGYMPGPPTRPSDSSRPASWPGAKLPPRRGGAARGPGPAAGELMPCEGGQQLGRVGSDIILSGELRRDLRHDGPVIDERLPPEKIAEQRKQLVQEIKEAVADLAAHSNDPNPLAGVSPADTRC